MKKTALLLIPAALLAACATTPVGPGVMVLPGSGKNFDQFRFDDQECRQYASAQIGGATPDQAALDSGAKSAAAGAAIGALAGAAISRSGHGAVAGAGLGAAGGGIAGTGTGSVSGRTVQQRYDMGYQQCMYAKGHQIPTVGRYDRTLAQPARPSVPPPPPPPPPGSPPPPPPKAG